MKKIILAFSALAIFSISFAQPGPGRDFKKHHRGDRGTISKGMDLTEAQQKEMKTLNESFKMQMQDLNKLNDITVGEQRSRREAIVKSHREKIQSLLTPEQKQKMQARKMEAGKRMQKHSGAQIDQMREKLNLTEQQVATIKANREANMSKVKAIRENTSLSSEQKMQQMKALRNEMKSGMDKVLLAEQKAKWNEIRKEHKGGRKGMGKRPAKQPNV